MAGPHDRFFRYLFNHPGRAEALLRHHLPTSLVAEVDWASLRRESGTLADWDRETRKDLLFSARCRHSATEVPPHFFLVEHQSSVNPWMALRMHDYAWRLIQHWRTLHPKSQRIPEVTPLVVYPRLDRSWSAALRLEDLYPTQVPAAGEEPRQRCAPRSEYLLAAVRSERAARAHPGPALVPLGLLVLSFAGTQQMAIRLPHWRDLFAQVHATDGPQTLYRVVRYVHQLGDEAAVASLRRVLHSIMESTRADTFMRTMAEVLRERGHQQGLAEGEARGEARGLAKALLRLLELKGVQVDEVARQRIQKCMEMSTLERWLDRAVNATQISEVLDGPAQ